MRYVWMMVSLPIGNDPTLALFSNRRKAERAFWKQVKHDQMMGLNTDTNTDKQVYTCVSTFEKTGDQVIHEVKRVKVY